MESMKVSIITVTYNSEDTIAKTINSIREQSYKNIEYIIVDGVSTDGTSDVIGRYRERIDIYVSEPDAGIYDAMNKGIGLATGNVIGIINSDDWYDFDTVEKAVDAIKKNKADAVCGSIRYYAENGEKLNIQDVHSVPDEHSMECRMSIAHPTVFATKTFYEKYGLFDTDYPISADYELLLRSIKTGAKVVYSPEIYANFRLGGASAKCSFQSIRDVHNARTRHGVNIIKRYYFCFIDLLVYFYTQARNWIKGLG